MKTILIMLALLSVAAQSQDIKKKVAADLKAAGYKVEMKDTSRLVVTKPANMYEDTEFEVDLWFVKLPDREVINVVTVVDFYYYSDTLYREQTRNALAANMYTACGSFFSYDYSEGKTPAMGVFCSYEMTVSCYRIGALVNLIECMRSKVERWKQAASSGYSSFELNKIPRDYFDAVMRSAGK